MWQRTGGCAVRWWFVMALLAMGACDGGGGGPGDGGPVVGDEAIAGTSPSDNATGVSTETDITITFATAAIPGTEDGGIEPAVDFDTAWSPDNTTLTVSLFAPLESGTTYTVTLTALSFADGTRLGAPYSFSFTVGQADDEPDNGDEPVGDCTPMTCPFVDSTATMAVLCTTPTPCSTNVSTTDALVVEFTQPFDLNDLGADILSETGQSFDVAISQSTDGTTLVATPTTPLLDDHTYAIVIDFVSDLQGNRTEIDQTFCFSTGATLNCPSAPECQDHDATDGGVSPAADFDYGRPFADDSVFNTPIGDNPEIDPDSPTLIAGFTDVYNTQGGIVVSVRQDAVPVYIADENTPRVTVELTDVFATADTIENVPLPPEALPDCGFDTLLSAFDPATGIYYEFWRGVKNDDGTWQASTGNTIDAATASGIYPGNGVDSSDGIRASGFSLLAGMIWPHELDAGVIDHAIVFYYFPTRSGGPVAPAVASDGAVDDPSALPMGSHLQLDPDLDLDALDLEPWERTIAVALQTYGMILGDTGSGIGLAMLHAYSFQGNPYDGLLPDDVITEGVVFFDKLPPDRFRVLRPPE
ncbi:MAG: Ig-like domain-containing protein [Phycisphaerales bacterium]|nr:MAG: Ig-like domain-containing protein [Phycisphaerales bacterium]